MHPVWGTFNVSTYENKANKNIQIPRKRSFKLDYHRLAIKWEIQNRDIYVVVQISTVTFMSWCVFSIYIRILIYGLAYMVWFMSFGFMPFDTNGVSYII